MPRGVRNVVVRRRSGAFVTVRPEHNWGGWQKAYDLAAITGETLEDCRAKLAANPSALEEAKAGRAATRPRGTQASDEATRPRRKKRRRRLGAAANTPGDILAVEGNGAVSETGVRGRRRQGPHLTAVREGMVVSGAALIHAARLLRGCKGNFAEANRVLTIVGSIAADIPSNETPIAEPATSMQ